MFAVYSNCVVQMVGKLPSWPSEFCRIGHAPCVFAAAFRRNTLVFCPLSVVEFNTHGMIDVLANIGREEKGVLDERVEGLSRGDTK